MFEYKFPDIGEGIVEGTLIKWLVQEGDEVKEGQDLAEVETDKVTANIPSSVHGKVAKLHADEGDTIHVGHVFISIDDKGDAETTDEPEDGMQVVSVSEGESDDADTAANDPVEEETAGVVGEVIATSNLIPPSTERESEPEESQAPRKVLATPVARKMAKDLGVDIQTLKGSGPGGRVMKEDIQKAAAPKKEEPAAEVAHLPEGGIRREPLTRIRKTISEKMSQSAFTAVHTSLFEEVEVSALVKFREKVKNAFGEENRITYLPFLVKAVVLALKAHPVFNSSLDEEEQAILYKEFYNIGIATDTERGLMVPVLFDADRKSIETLSKEIKEIAKRSHEGTLTLDALRGGTFSITNYGAIGGSFGTPIINYPETAILGVGRIAKKPVVKDGRIAVGNVLPLSLSYDHRIIDGANAVRFMKTLEEVLQDPELLLLRI